jgi:hypothetical protein
MWVNGWVVIWREVICQLCVVEQQYISYWPHVSGGWGANNKSNEWFCGLTCNQVIFQCHKHKPKLGFDPWVFS